MACELCGRSSCTRCFHSLDEQEDALRALRAENARLKEALQGMVKLVDDGLLVRSIANDHIAGWGIRALPIVQALQQANEALQPKEPGHD